MELIDGAEPLVRNMVRLKAMIRPQRDKPRIAVMGQPGAGKSTLLSALSQGLVRPRPAVGVESDVTRWCDSTDVDLIAYCPEALWIDVPGHGTRLHPALQLASWLPFRDFDTILFVFSGKLLATDHVMMKAVKRWRDRLIFVRHRAESLSAEDRRSVVLDLHRQLEDAFGGDQVPFDNATGYRLDGGRPFVAFTDCRTGEGLQALREAALRSDVIVR